MQTLLGTKLEMSQIFQGEDRLPVTWLVVGPCIVTHVKSMDKDGYWAVQLGFATRNTKHISKPLKGHLKGAVKDKTAPRFLCEVRFDSEPDVKVGDEIKLTDVFSVGDEVAVTGVTKGKGFAGVVKRWKFAGGPATHGQSDRERAPGSIGLGTTPGRVFKGKKMGGRMGTKTIRVVNLPVVALDADASKLAVRGGVPGALGTLLVIEKTGKAKTKIVQDQPQMEDAEAAKEEAIKEVSEEKPEEVKE